MSREADHSTGGLSGGHTVDRELLGNDRSLDRRLSRAHTARQGGVERGRSFDRGLSGGHTVDMALLRIYLNYFKKYFTDSRNKSKSSSKYFKSILETIHNIIKNSSKQALER